jgi:hypothetical protein
MAGVRILFFSLGFGYGNDAKIAKCAVVAAGCSGCKEFRVFFKKPEKDFGRIRKILSLQSQKRHTLSGKRSKDKNR